MSERSYQGSIYGYLHPEILNGASGEETVRALCAAAGGEGTFSPKLAQRLEQHFVVPRSAGLFPKLTEREGEILALLA